MHRQFSNDTIATTQINMVKVCPITGKSSKMAQTRVNRFRANFYIPGKKFRRYANLQKKTIFIPELGKKMILTLSTKAIRTINKNGAYKTLKKAGLI